MISTARTPTRRLAPSSAISRSGASRPGHVRPDLEVQELNHRVANSLQLAADLLAFEEMRLRDPVARAALEASRARLVAVAELHRFLTAHGARNGVDLAAFLQQLGPAISATTGLDCVVKAAALPVSADLAQQVAIAINELAVNAAKHAYAGRPGGRLTIEVVQRAAQIVLTVSDQGPGVTGDGHRGLGTTILAALVRDMKGSLSVRNEGGARFTLHIPLPAAPVRIDRSFQAWASSD